MKCPNCGVDNNDDSRFCSGCGTELKAAVTVSVENTESQAKVEEKPGKVGEKAGKKKSGCLKYGLIALGALIVLFILLASCGGGDSGVIEAAQSLVFDAYDENQTLGDAVAKTFEGEWKSSDNRFAVFSGKDRESRKWEITVKMGDDNQAGEITNIQVGKHSFSPYGDEEAMDLVMSYIFSGGSMIFDEDALKEATYERLEVGQTAAQPEQTTAQKENASRNAPTTIKDGLTKYTVLGYSGEDSDEYIDGCYWMSAKDAMRNLEKGGKVAFAGRVYTVIRSGDHDQIFLRTDDSDLWVVYDFRVDGGSKILEGDTLSVFGDYVDIGSDIFDGEYPIIAGRYIYIGN